MDRPSPYRRRTGRGRMRTPRDREVDRPLSPVLRLSQRNEPADLDPATAILPDEFFIIRALSEGLVTPAPDGGAVTLAAAQSWEASPDHLTWTFHLRPDGRWSNGDPVTADDFVASYRRLLTPATGAPKAGLFYPVKNARAFVAGEITDFSVVGLRASDAHTLVVTLGGPTPEFLAYAASGPWIPENPGAVARHGREWTRPENYVGNGPYLLTQWRPNQLIAVRKNPQYHGAADIRVEEIQFVRLDDDNTEERAYRSGEVDVTMTVPFSKLLSYVHEKDGDLHHAPLAETRYLAFNTLRPPLNDLRVRRALSLALDRDRLVTLVLHGGQIPAERLLAPGIAPPGSQAAGAHSPPGTEGFSGDVTDPAQARSLLAAAGFPGGRGFPRLELAGWNNTPLLEAIQEMWKKELGIEVATTIREARVHIASLLSGKYDIGLVALIPDVADPLSVLEEFTTGSPNNYPHWSDPAYDRLVGSAAASVESAARNEQLRAAESRLLRDCPPRPALFQRPELADASHRPRLAPGRPLEPRLPRTSGRPEPCPSVTSPFAQLPFFAANP